MSKLAHSCDATMEQIERQARQNERSEVTEPSVADILDADLVERAVRNCLASKWVKQPRWVAISENFALGRTYSRQLCRRFGLDPDQMVSRDPPHTEE